MMKNTQPLNIAHRGARSVAPENTLLAAQKGLDLGADGWELDVAMTADSELVIIHDRNLARTSNAITVFPDRAPWEVHKFTLAELRKLDFGSWFIKTDPFDQIAAGNVTAKDQYSFQHLQIPTLREALEFTKQNKWLVNVELKDQTGTPGDKNIVENAVALIVEMQMENNLIISSFNHPYLARVKKMEPAITTAVLVEQAVADPVALLESLDARAYNPSIDASNAPHFSSLRKANKDIYPWTVNDETTMRNLLIMGATGLITDFPQRLRTVLDFFEGIQQ